MDNHLIQQESEYMEDVIQDINNEETVGPSRAPTEGDIHDPKEYPQAPFIYGSGINETVVLSNGSLQYFASDFTLPGRNGFDLSIVRKYDSNSANIHDIAPKYNGTSSFSTVRNNCGWLSELILHKINE